MIVNIFMIQTDTETDTSTSIFKVAINAEMNGWDIQESKHTCRQTVRNMETVIVCTCMNNQIYHAPSKCDNPNMIQSRIPMHM